jgi:hypothetical protein
MHRGFALVLGVLLLLSAQVETLAQEAPPLRDDFRRSRPVLFPGDVVRITASAISPDFIEGRVVGLGSDTLVVEGRKESEGRTAVAYDDMEQLEVLDESTSGIGAIFGVLAGIAIGATVADQLTDNSSSFLRSLAVVGGAMLGAYGGYWGGVRVERLIAGPKWEPVPISQLQLGFGPTLSGQFGFTVSYSF